jgi:hypothetical protein
MQMSISEQEEMPSLCTLPSRYRLLLRTCHFAQRRPRGMLHLQDDM